METQDEGGKNGGGLVRRGTRDIERLLGGAKKNRRKRRGPTCRRWEGLLGACRGRWEGAKSRCGEPGGRGSQENNHKGATRRRKREGLQQSNCGKELEEDKQDHIDGKISKG